MNIFLVVGLALMAWGTWAAASARSRWQSTGGSAGGILACLVNSVILSVVVLVIGTFPWYFLENATNADIAASGVGGGPAFVLLIWFVLGPLISFAIVPGAYALFTHFNFRKIYKIAVLPALTIIPFTVYYAVSSAQYASAHPYYYHQELIFIALFDLWALVGWLIYVFGMDYSLGVPDKG